MCRPVQRLLAPVCSRYGWLIGCTAHAVMVAARHNSRLSQLLPCAFSLQYAAGKASCHPGAGHVPSRWLHARIASFPSNRPVQRLLGSQHAAGKAGCSEVHGTCFSVAACQSRTLPSGHPVQCLLLQYAAGESGHHCSVLRLCVAAASSHHHQSGREQSWGCMCLLLHHHLGREVQATPISEACGC